MSIFVWMCIVLTLLTGTAAGAEREVIPKVGVFMSAEDILRARELTETAGWAKSLKNSILQQADKWVNVSDDYIRQLMPKEGSTFAYGTAGCPEHNISWTSFGRNGIADLNQPGVLRCPGGHLIDFDNPNSKYYDDGRGVVINNVRYFFRGVYNAAIVNTFTGWGSDDGVLHYLAYAFALTGEDKYAEKAAVILDCLAHLSPTTIGPRDFNPNEPNRVTGRLHLLTSIVHRTKVHYVRSYDILYNHPAMQAKSFYSDKTVAENVAEGLLLDYMFHEFDLRGGNFSTFHNHEADELRGMLAVGLVLGIPEYIKWGLEGFSYFLENTIDKDGLYYEGSPSYANFVQNVFSDIAEMAYHYDPAKYDASDLPERINYYDHPKLREFLFGNRDKLDVAGHYASFGNAASDTKRILEFSRSPGSEFGFVDRLYHRTEIPELKEKYRDAMLELSQGNPDNLRSGTWALFAVELPTGEIEKRYRDIDVAITAYYSTKSLAILGSGEGINRRGLLIRGGPSLPHSHDDILALFFYDKGYMLSQDNGYNIFGTPVHRGWATRAISHNLVVVDNDIYRKDNWWYKNSPGADLKAFVDLPGMKYVHLDNPHQFPNSAKISEYSRRVALIDIDDMESYVFDVFTVSGGKRHDYSFHTGAPILASDTQFESIPGVWTLAGLDYPDATYDEQGKSWGERIIPGDLIRDLGVRSEGVNESFNPAPGNGYGFIYDLQEGTLENDTFTGRFMYFDGSDTIVTNRLFVDQETKLYKGTGPNLYGSEKYPYIILRSESPENHHSRVISIMDAASGFSPIIDVQRLDANAFSIEIWDGQKHFILLEGGSAETPKGRFVSQAEFAIAKFNGDEFVEVVVVGPGFAQLGDEKILAEQESAEILDVDFDASKITVSSSLDVEPGDLVVIDSDRYRRNAAYKVLEVETDGSNQVLYLEGSFVLAKGFVTKKNNRLLNINAPLAIGYSYTESTGLLEGKSIIRTKTGENGPIRSIGGFKAVYLREDVPFEEGDDFIIVDLFQGDTVTTLPTTVYKN